MTHLFDERSLVVEMEDACGNSTFFTYDGPTIGVNTTISYQDPRYGHHAQLLETILDEQSAPDGYVMDCTSYEDFNMAQTETFYVPKPEGAGIAGMRLPEGFAVKLEGGKRLVLQSHYVNYEEVPLLARDAVQVIPVPEEEVTTWAAAIAQPESSPAPPQHTKR